MSDSLCPFCQEDKNRNANVIGKNRIVAETDNFIIFPTVGGFVENYQLIAPKKHINCFGQLTSDEWNELKIIITWQRRINKQYFSSSSLMFEHGSLMSNNESGKSIIHAHLHIFPSNYSLLNGIRKYNFSIQEIIDISQLTEICYKYKSYLYYSDLNEKDYIITHRGLPSQFLRKVLADSLGISSWNWREFPYLESIENCLRFYEANPQIYDYLNGG